MLLVLLVDLLCVQGVAVVCLVDHFVYYYHPEWLVSKGFLLCGMVVPEKLVTLEEAFYSVVLVQLLQEGGRC